jgi:hypothetical protein
MVRIASPLAFGLTLALALPCLPQAARASDCSRDSTGLVPITDLGSGFYLGFQGGLYPGGANSRPATHEAAGVAIGQAIQPLDTLGVPDPNGRIVIASIGMSNATQEFRAFLPKLASDPERHPRLLAVDAAVGGQPANVIRSPQAAYWDSVAARLRTAGSSPSQVQAVWIKEANARPTGGFPASAETLQWNLAAIARVLKQKLPNVRLAYLTSRIYAGYATTNLNPEPYAYESGFAVQWLIRSQIEGVDSLNYDPLLGPVEAPWLSWGPYLWADGLEPRSDGLTWPCDFFASDGTHPAQGARDLVADSLLAFWKRDPTSAPWFRAPVTAAPAGEEAPARFQVLAGPSPASRRLSVRVRPARPGDRVELVSASGRRVRTAALTRSGADEAAAVLDVQGLSSGVYVLRVRGAGGRRDAEGPVRKVVIAR